jgi:ElaB/YqjD/DUF883 family membrane-anchored ribosome-binding protein
MSATNGQGAKSQKAADKVAQHVDNVAEAAQTMRDEAKAAGQGLADAFGLQQRVEANPYGMVAAALGIGYVLGGGLFTPTTGRILRMGMKLAAVPAVRNELLAVAERAVDQMLDQSRKITHAEPRE